MAERETLTLEELRQALADPTLRRTVVAHVSRAGISEDEALRFLIDALRSDSVSVRRDAAMALRERGKLNEVVRALLWELASGDDVSQRETAVLALEYVEIDYRQVPETYWQAVIAALGSNDPRVQRSAAAQLERWGAASTPSLLDALRGDDERIRRAAAEVLARVLGQPAVAVRPSAIEVPGAQAAPFKEAPPGKFVPPPPTGASPVRLVDPHAATSVRVYFGTNREFVGQSRSPWASLVMGGIGCGAGLGLIGWEWRRGRDGIQRRRQRALQAGIILGGFALAGWSLLAGNDALRQILAPGASAPFGARRDDRGAIHYGACVVTIPPTHVEGNLEEAPFGPDRESEHVRLQKTDLLDEQAFFDEVRRAVEPDSVSPRDCFVFVHGYNVTFERAAKRTAQIHFDLKFPGVPLFFSWPSRGNFADYSLDRDEIENRSYLDVQRFLVDVARRSGARRVHVLAHSMGADAVSRAIRELGSEGRIFDQVILAAPDIDRRVFLEEIAPRMREHSRRTTLYCSRNDRALLFSRYWNSPGNPQPRVGDSTNGPVIIREMDTIDASTIRTDLLGHSYYGDCVPLLNDVGLLLREGLTPDQRPLEVRVTDTAEPGQPRQYWAIPESP